MGYDLHITKAREWTDSEKKPVAVEKWLATVAANQDLELHEGRDARWTGHPGGEDVLFVYDRGAISVKNPDEPTLARAISLAHALDARAVGDDGEEYEEPDAGPRPASPSLAAQVSGWFGRLRPAPPIPSAEVPFTVGDRVRDSWGNEATVVSIDLRAEHGLGIIRVRYDDGRELQSAVVAHGLTRV